MHCSLTTLKDVTPTTETCLTGWYSVRGRKIFQVSWTRNVKSRVQDT
jgi:hypothetical protein